MLRKILLAAAFIPALAACATADPQSNPQKTAAIDAACTKIMRLPPGAEYGACVSSLSDSVAGLVQASYANNAFRECARAGLKPETPEFSRCVLDRESVQTDAGGMPAEVAAKLNAAYIAPADPDTASYFSSTPKIRYRREQYACAGLGFEPDTNAFVSCVNNLDMEIFALDHPS